MTFKYIYSKHDWDFNENENYVPSDPQCFTNTYKADNKICHNNVVLDKEKEEFFCPGANAAYKYPAEACCGDQVVNNPDVNKNRLICC